MTASLIGEDRSDWLRGEIHTASDSYARYLIARGAAVLVEGDEALPPPALSTKAFIAPDPVATHRDPIGPRKGRG
jgi:hypothetical protein